MSRACDIDTSQIYPYIYIYRFEESTDLIYIKDSGISKHNKYFQVKKNEEEEERRRKVETVFDITAFTDLPLWNSNDPLNFFRSFKFTLFSSSMQLSKNGYLILNTEGYYGTSVTKERIYFQQEKKKEYRECSTFITSYLSESKFIYLNNPTILLYRLKSTIIFQ